MKKSTETLQHWIDHVVVGLDLCPWAKPVVERGGLHLAISEAASPERALAFFLQEMELLLITPGRETTLLAFPRWVIPFTLFWDVVGLLEEELEYLELHSQIQLVAFHPDFIFAGVPADSMAHWVNRSPYPIVHLLRVDDVARATAENLERAQALSYRNEDRLTKLSLADRRRLFPWKF